MRIEPADDDEGIALVYRLYRAHAETLGFMPEGAFRDRAAKGMLLVAADAGGRTVGYVLFDLPRRHVALRHLCVDETAAGTGVARALVEAVVELHSQRLGIMLRCRNDYPASRVWPKLDFEPVAERSGRSQAGYLVTTWWRDFGHPTLFSALGADVAPARSVALDTDVFIDLSGDADRSEESAPLLADWLAGLFELFVTKEVAIEVNNNSDPAERSRQRVRLSAFARRDEPTALWQPLADQLRAAAISGGRSLTEHDERDIRHIARAAAVGADHFLTRDENLVRRLGSEATRLGVNVTTPGQFIAAVASETEDSYAPVALEDTTFSLTSVDLYSHDEIVRRFLNMAAGERANRLRHALRSASANPKSTESRVVVDGVGAPVALFLRRTDARGIEVPILRVAGLMAPTLGRHVAYLQRRFAIDTGHQRLRVTDGHLSPVLPAALEAEGYVAQGDVWYATPLRLQGSAARLANAIAETGAAPELVELLEVGDTAPSIADELERRYSPMKLLGSGIATYLVPIRYEWAAALFDTGLSEQRLFHRSDVLGMSREHVYYSGALRRSVRLPARLVWYVSGQRGPGGQSVRAVSRLDEAAVDRPRTLYRRFQHLGVWQLEEVERVAVRGNALALRFSDTELLPRPVPLKELRSMAAAARYTLVLRSIAELPEQMFASLYQRGTDETD